MQEFGLTIPGKRRANDFYPTSDEATEALARRYAPVMGRVLEPACGDGAIMRVLRRHGVHCVGTDLVHRGAGIGGIDFLTLRPDTLHDRWSVVTNPPFDKAGAFIEKAHEIRAPFVAMMLKASFWCVGKHLRVWKMRPPQAIHPLTWRPDFTGQGSPFLNVMWCVWGDIPFSADPLERP